MPVAVLSLVLPLALPAEAADSLPSPSPVVYSVVRGIGRWGGDSSYAERGTCPDRRSSPAEIIEAIRRRGRRPGKRSSSLRQAGIPGPHSSIGHQDPDGPPRPVEVLGVSTRLATRTSEQANVVYLIGGGDATLPRSLASDAQPKRSGFPEAPGPEHRHGSWGTTKVDVVFDDSLFTGRPLGPGWAKRFPNAGVAAPVSALMIDQGRKSRSSRARVADPAKRAAQVFANILENRGVTVGRVSRGRAPDSAKELARVESAAGRGNGCSACSLNPTTTSRRHSGHLVGKELLNDGSFAGGARATSQVLSSAGSTPKTSPSSMPAACPHATVFLP